MDSSRGVGGRLGCAALLLLLAVPAGAQGPPLDCQDRQGHPVPIQIDKHIAYPAYATVDANGAPRIYWNPKSANGRSEAWRRFVLLHECGHILLHHVAQSFSSVEERRRAEREADCFAILALKDARGINGSDLTRLFSDLSRTRSDATHLGGEELLESLQECQNARTDSRRWRETLNRLLSASADSFESITGPPLGLSWAGTVHEATLDLPGTYDCEIRPPRSFVCLMVAAEDARSAHQRFTEFKRFVVGWLPEDWTHSDRLAGTGPQPELFLAQSSSDGTFLALVRTAGSRVYFVARPAGPLGLP